jgi:hypothetical protein
MLWLLSLRVVANEGRTETVQRLARQQARVWRSRGQDCRSQRGLGMMSAPGLFMTEGSTVTSVWGKQAGSARTHKRR